LACPSETSRTQLFYRGDRLSTTPLPTVSLLLTRRETRPQNINQRISQVKHQYLHPPSRPESSPSTLSLSHLNDTCHSPLPRCLHPTSKPVTTPPCHPLSEGCTRNWLLPRCCSRTWRRSWMQCRSWEYTVELSKCSVPVPVKLQCYAKVSS
jgi:hypothetical protein